MTLPRARIVRPRGAERRDAGPVAQAPLRTHVLKGVVAEASLEAARRLESAERRAHEVIAAAQSEAAATRQRAYTEARAAAEADLAAAWIALRAEESRLDERAVDRTIALARAMSERLLGEALEADPTRVLALAREALASARNARRVIVYAHPVDAAVLTAQLHELDLEGASVQIHADEARTRGSLYFETDLGTLDAQLTLQLDRLTHALRETRRR